MVSALREGLRRTSVSTSGSATARARNAAVGPTTGRESADRERARGHSAVVARVPEGADRAELAFVGAFVHGGDGAVLQGAESETEDDAAGEHEGSAGERRHRRHTGGGERDPGEEQAAVPQTVSVASGEPAPQARCRRLGQEQRGSECGCGPGQCARNAGHDHPRDGRGRGEHERRPQQFPGAQAGEGAGPASAGGAGTERLCLRSALPAGPCANRRHREQGHHSGDREHHGRAARVAQRHPEWEGEQRRDGAHQPGQCEALAAAIRGDERGGDRPSRDDRQREPQPAQHADGHQDGEGQREQQDEGRPAEQHEPGSEDHPDAEPLHQPRAEELAGDRRREQRAVGDPAAERGRRVRQERHRSEREEEADGAGDDRDEPQEERARHQRRPVRKGGDAEACRCHGNDPRFGVDCQ